MSTHTVEAFSVSHAAILDGTTGAEAVNGDIFGVRSAALAADIGSFDNTGDDAVISSWYWFNFATLTITGGFIPFSMIELLTGIPVRDYATSSAYAAKTPLDRSSATYQADLTAAVGNPQHVFEQELWTDQSMITAPKPVLIRMPSRDSAGVIRLLDFVLYRVQFSPINFTGPSYKAGLEVSYTGRAVMTDRDEKGMSLGTTTDGRAIRSVGRMISRPA
jgi:hypothetical protein